MSRAQVRLVASRSVSAAVRIALGCGIFAIAATPVIAAEDDEELAEVVVTAQFREQSVQDTPLAITAVSAEMLEQRSQTNIAEVANQAPSVTLRQSAPMYGPGVAAYVRGIGQLDFNPAVEPGVGMYVDDVYYATLTGSLLDLLDLERVEILRGPQGTLAGKNSIGGSIKLYSQKPRPEDSGSFSATYGSRDRTDLRGTANFALTDTLSMRISGVDKKQDGYIKRIDYGCANPASGIAPLRAGLRGCVVARDSNVNFSAVRGALRWMATEDLELNLALDYTNDDRNPTGAVLVRANTIPNANMQPVPGATNLPLSAFVTPRGSYHYYASFYNTTAPWVGNLPVAGAYDTSLNGRTFGVGSPALAMKESRPEARQFFKGGGTSLTADWKLLDSLSLKSISAWRWYDSGFVNDNDMSPLMSSIGDGTLPFHSFSEELRLNGSLFDSKVVWTGGVFYMSQVSRYESWQDLRYNGQANSYVAEYQASADAKRNPLQFQQDDRVAAKTKAVFAHASWNIFDPLTLNAGLRFTDEEKSYTFVRLNQDGSPQSFIGGLNGQTRTYEGDNLDYRVNLQYDWLPELMTYVQYATGFKGGGISPRPFVIGQAIPFDPETMNTIEAGVKSDLWGRKLRINASVYYGMYDDIQLSLQSCPASTGLVAPCGSWANAGDGKTKGLEIEATLRPLPGLSLDATYDYFDFEYSNVDPAVQSVGRPWHITEDDTLPFSPKSKFSVGATYEMSLANGSTIAPRVDFTHQGSFYTNGANQPSNFVDSYGLLNARVTWRSTDGTLDLAVEGTNLTDKYYYTSRADQLQAAGHTDGAPGRPREWAVTIKKRF